MFKKIFLLKILFVFILISVVSVLIVPPPNVFAADIHPDSPCRPGQDVCLNDDKGNGYACQPAFNKDGSPQFDATIKNQRRYTCQPSTVATAFGQIRAPEPLQKLLGTDPTGAGAISRFLSNFVVLIFSLAGVVLIFMILWGAFEWMTSAGDKEKLGAAQKRILNALIGLLIFAVTFAIIRVFGQFTGFTFFAGQNYTVISRDSQGNIEGIKCRSDGRTIHGIIRDPDAECRK